MSAEFWTFLGITVTAIASVIGTVLSSNKKTREGQISKLAEFQDEQAKQISQFQKDTRNEMSKLQDAYADSIVEVKTMITDLNARQQQYQAVMELKLENMTREFTDMKEEVKEHNGFAKRMPVVEEQIKVANHRIQDLEDSARNKR